MFSFSEFLVLQYVYLIVLMFKHVLQKNRSALAIGKLHFSL